MTDRLTTRFTDTDSPALSVFINGALAGELVFLPSERAAAKEIQRVIDDLGACKGCGGRGRFPLVGIGGVVEDVMCGDCHGTGRQP